jgi:hypothetical protein
MRALIVFGMLVLTTSFASPTTANAQRGCSALACQCRVQCGVQGRGNNTTQTPAVQACVDKCVATKKAAQH